MAHFCTTFESTAEPAAACRYIADFSNTAAWDPTVVRARTLSPEPVCEGSRFEVVLGLAGREIVFDYRLRRLEPDRLIVLECENDWLRSLDTIEIEPTAGGCRVRYDADLRPRGAAYLLDLPLHLAFQVSGARSAQGLQRALGRLPRRDDAGAAEPMPLAQASAG